MNMRITWEVKKPDDKFVWYWYPIPFPDHLFYKTTWTVERILAATKPLKWYLSVPNTASDNWKCFQEMNYS